ncbi:MAG: YchJ family metal-binding protein [Planctomycetota bacterium]
MNRDGAPCRCGRPATLMECCLPYVEGKLQAPDPESLMRSRYTAFALGTLAATEYLYATHHPDFREPQLREGLRSSIADVDAWTRLEVLASSVDGDRGAVEFIATFRLGGEEKKLHEHSAFVREGGRWYYTKGVIR